MPPSETEAPGAADFTFGSLLTEMIRHCFVRVETLDPDRRHHFYSQCRFCQGDDLQRALGKRPSLLLVEHTADCSLGKHLPRLRAMANKDVT